MHDYQIKDGDQWIDVLGAKELPGVPGCPSSEGWLSYRRYGPIKEWIAAPGMWRIKLVR